MQLPSVERTSNVRPVGADSTSSGANRVIPVAPVNPSVSESPPLEPVPGVVNHVSPATQAAAKATASATEGQPVYTSVPDPVKNTASSQQNPHDWTIHKPAPEKQAASPTKPISQVLLDQLKTLWTASASAVQLEQVKNQVTPPVPVAPSQLHGEVAKQALIYEPSKIKKPSGL